MVKTKLLTIRLTENQFDELKIKSESFGFIKISEYVRSIIFGRLNLEDEKNDKNT